MVGGDLKQVYFTGHHAYIISIAKLCKDSDKFTDVSIQCSDGKLRAHRLVLAACSNFLGKAFKDLPQGLSEYTLIVPNIPKSVVEILIDFLYTGKMTLPRNNTYDLQQLVHILQIDPENVKIETADSGENNSKIIKTVLGVKINNTSLNNEESSNSRTSLKRRTSSSAINDETTSSPPTKEPKVGNSTTVARGHPRTRGGRNRANRGTDRRNANSMQSPPPPPTLAAPAPVSTNETGFHDISNVETWVCAICLDYDPPSTTDKQTEWVGCDCDRWYHQYCTKLKVIGKEFCCATVKLKCLPPKGI